MVRAWVVAALFAAGVFGGDAAQSAEIKVRPTDVPSIKIITVTGEFTENDGETFSRLSQRIGRAIVAFDSPGGALIAGLQMGQIIRLRHFVTFVPADTMCASACAIAWLAGSPRAMQPGSRIGFHAAFDRDTHEVTGVGNALVGAYLSRLGLSDAAVIYVEQADPDDVTWLTVADAHRIGLEVRVVPVSDQPRRRPESPAPEPAPPHEPPSSPKVTLPFLVAPLEPEPQAPPQSLAAQATAFVSDYFAYWSESNDQALDYFSSIYALQVMFYGKQLDRSTIMQQKQSYTKRWPIRVYTVRPETMRSFCVDATQTCVVTGVVDWDCRSAAHGNHSVGVANFSLTVSLARSRGQIIAEAGSVISRNTQ